MNIIKNLKELFNFSRDEKNNKKSLLEQAQNSKMEGQYQDALKHWQELQEETDGIDPRLCFEKSRIHILLNERENARAEIMKFIHWYYEQDEINYNSTYFTIFISALQDLGYLQSSWPDQEEYIDNLAGRDITLNRAQVINRIQEGLKVLEEEEMWSQDLELIKKNIARLINIEEKHIN